MKYKVSLLMVVIKVDHMICPLL